MYIIILKCCIVLSIVSPSLSAQNGYRKYNVDEESFKLYGEDFKSVLKRFRRTPDYLKILQDKLGELKTSAKEMSLQVLHYYHGKLEDRVNEIIPTTTTAAGPPQTEEPKENVYFHAGGTRRQGETSPVEDNWQKIQNLDNYRIFESLLTVAERNSLKDLGFEFAGKIVHSIIENMGPTSSGSTVKFTHSPEGGPSAEKTETEPTTTMHPSEHSGTPTEETEAETETVTETVTEEEITTTTTEPSETRRNMQMFHLADVMQALKNKPNMHLNWSK